MLVTKKEITLTGQSMINGTQVVFMTAKVSTDGTSNGSVTQNIMNEALYKANKTECRKDISAFQDVVYDTQDSIETEAAEAEDKAE